jgi:hypothetical protein
MAGSSAAGANEPAHRELAAKGLSASSPGLGRRSRPLIIHDLGRSDSRRHGEPSLAEK